MEKNTYISYFIAAGLPNYIKTSLLQLLLHRDNTRGEGLMEDEELA